MVDQAQQINGSGRADETPPRAVARSAGELLSDLVTLAELQARLCLVDAQEGLDRLLRPTIVLVAGIVVALGCVPVALTALALLLVEAARLTYAQAFGIALAVGILLAAGLCGAGVASLRHWSNVFNRSRTEWHMNMRWGKDALARLSRTGIHQRRFP